MGLAAAAAGKRKSTPAASYHESDDEHDDDDDVDDDEFPASKKQKTPSSAATATQAKKTKAVTAPSAKKAKAPTALQEAKAVSAKLTVLDRSQLQGLLKSLLEAGSVSPTDVEALLPAPDMSAYVKEGERLSKSISRALPNSRWGSCTDHYGYKRCASAANACKKYIVDNAKVFKQAKQWPAALEYCVAMLPVARGMVEFDLPDDRKARNGAIETLTALKLEAQKKLGLEPPAAATSAAVAPVVTNPALGLVVETAD